MLVLSRTEWQLNLLFSLGSHQSHQITCNHSGFFRSEPGVDSVVGLQTVGHLIPSAVCSCSGVQGVTLRGMGTPGFSAALFTYLGWIQRQVWPLKTIIFTFDLCIYLVCSWVWVHTCSWHIYGGQRVALRLVITWALDSCMRGATWIFLVAIIQSHIYH